MTATVMNTCENFHNKKYGGK